MTGQRVLLAGVVSRTHLLYAASWLREQQSLGRTVSDVLVRAPRPFLGRIRVTAEECIEMLSDAVEAPVRVEDVSSAPPASAGGGPDGRVLLCVGAPALRQLLPALRASRSMPRIVVVDEGIGSYGDRATRAAAYRRNGSSWIWSQVRAGVVSAGHRLLTREHWGTYRRTAGGWQLNEAVAAEFRRRLGGEPSAPGLCVLLTQPWPALGVMTEQAYRAHIDEVDRACRDAGLRLAVRPHPADSATSYLGLTVLPHDVPAELDRLVVEADVVLGAASTALLNIAAFYGTRCLRLDAPELAVLDGQLGADQAALLDTFLPAPRLVRDLDLARRRTDPST